MAAFLKLIWKITTPKSTFAAGAVDPSFIVVMGPLVFLINGFTKHDWLEALLFAVAVAVRPEMLPMIVTVNLAKGATAMARAK